MNIASTFQLVLAIVGLQCAASLIVVNEFPSTQHLAQKQAIVVVRTYRPQIAMLEPFIHYLLNGSSSVVDIKFLIVPTESGDLGVFQDIATNLSSSGIDIEVPPFLTPEFYVEARTAMVKCKRELNGPTLEFSKGLCLAPYECSPVKWETTFARNPWAYQRQYNTICVYENSMHYWLVDRTIDYAMILTERYSYNKTSLLVTNADNIYQKGFLEKLMSLPAPIAISDWHERGPDPNCTEARIAPSKIDLGAFIVDIEVLREHNIRFSTSIPSFANDTQYVAEMRAFHDADWWYLAKLVNETKIPFRILDECLFRHERKMQSLDHGTPGIIPSWFPDMLNSWLRAPDLL